MSDYNFYAKHLDESFKKARSTYADAYNALEKAKAEYEDSKKWHSEKRIGDNDQRRRRAELAYLEAKDAFEKVRREAWNQYDREVAELTSRFKKTIAEDNIADSDEVDSGAIKLMESGIMNVADYESMINKFDGNAAMTRLLSKNMRERAEQSKDITERNRLYMLANATKNGASQKEKEWDSLLESAKIFSGRHTSDKPEPGFAVRMAGRWDEVAAQTIENF